MKGIDEFFHIIYFVLGFIFFQFTGNIFLGAGLCVGASSLYMYLTNKYCKEVLND